MNQWFRRVFLYHVLMVTVGGMPCFSDSCAFEKKLTIPWGFDEGEVGIRWHPAGNFGPSDFAIIDRGTSAPERSHLYLLDTVNSSLVLYAMDNPGEIDRYPIPENCRTFIVHDTSIVLWDGHSLHLLDCDTRRKVSTSHSLPIRAVDRMFIHGVDLFLIDERGRQFSINKMEEHLLLTPSTDVLRIPNTEKTGIQSFSLTSPGNHSVHVEYPFEIASIEYVGSTDSVLCIVIERIVSHVPLMAEESIVFITHQGNILHTIDLPFVYYTNFHRRIKLFDSKVYVFISDPAGLLLYSADLERVLREKSVLPELTSEPYHFNWYVPRNPAETDDQNTCRFHPISRDSVLCMARKYVDIKWAATDENVTEGIERMPDGTYVRTPAWVRPGKLMNVPYKWGGFTSIDDFAAGVVQGKKCGDDYLESMGHSDEYCIGVDCSGFVSRCWGMDEKYFTATMHEISHELPSYSSLQRGDALNKPHHHIRLVAEDLPSGMILTVEAGGEWRVCYHLCKHTTLVGYTPIRFNFIMDTFARDPFVIATRNVGEEIAVRRGPSFEEDQITTIHHAMKFVSTAYHNGWYHFHIPTGTGTYGGWCFGGEEAGTGFLTGYQDGAILTLVGETLNAYSGPGIGNSYVTTVSPGQRYAVFAEDSGWYGIYIANVPDDPTGWIYSGCAGDQIELIAGGPHDGYGAEILSLDYPAEISEGDVATCLLRLKNIGSCSWNGETMIRTTVPRGRSSLFASPGWIDSSTIKGMEQAVLPHQATTVHFEIRAPYVCHDSLFTESFGIKQEDFEWFGDTGQFGPGDSTLSMRIHVMDIGLPEAPVIELSNTDIENGIFRFSWNPVNTASHYGVFRGLFGSDHAPGRICITDGLGFSDSTGLHDSRRDVFYCVKAYCPCDSSGLSNHVGEFEFAAEKLQRRASVTP